jgi:O-antigen/teichoic acid export membrane protein
LSFTNKIAKSEFFINVITLVSGNAIAQIITLLITLILTRLYKPEDFGAFSIAMAIAGGIGTIASLRYELAIMRPKKDSDAYKVMILSLAICAIITIISSIVMSIVILMTATTPSWFILIPVMTFAIGLFQIFNNWANRQKKYKKIAASRIISSTFSSSLSAGFGLFPLGGIGLFLGNILGQFSSVINLINFSELKRNLKSTTLKDLKFWAKQYKDMPQTSLFQALVDVYLINGLTYLIPIFFGNAVVGFYSFSMRILQVPVSFIGSAIAQVFYQKANDAHHANENLRHIVKKTIKKSSLIALPMPLILIFFGPDLFAFVFSKEWRIGGEYAQILSPWIYFDFIRMTVSQVPIILRKQKHMLFTSFLGVLALTTSILTAGLIFNDIKIGLYFSSAFLSILAIYITFWIYKISDNKKI